MKRFYQLYGVALSKKKLREIVFVLMALEAIFAFSYLGYIDFPTISTTTLHILVIAAAMILGVQGSVPVVCVFSLTSMWIATYATTASDQVFSPFVSGSPVGSFMLVLARVLFAVISSWIFGICFRKPRKHPYAVIALVAVLSTFLHGLIILGGYYLFFPAIFPALSANLLSAPLFRDWFSYLSAAAVCCCVHFLLSVQSVKDHLSYLCTHASPNPDRGYQRALLLAKIGTAIIGVLCVLYLRKRIFGELQVHSAALAGASYLNITVSLLQLLCAFFCLFGIVSIIVRWLNEYYTMRQLEMNQTLNEQSVKISIDALTGVFSRFAYNDAIAAYADRIPADLAVFLIDINGLKAVNDTFGHEAGDELICGAAQCITAAVGSSGRTFRIGGDEFVVFGNMDRDQAEGTLAELNRITESWSGQEVKQLSVSAGYALAADFAGRSVEGLVIEADQAMYKQKQAYYRAKSRTLRQAIASAEHL